MSSGFNEPDFDSAAEVKDRTLWWWAAVGILVIAFLGALFIWGRSDPNVSRVRARHILISFDQNDPADRARALERAQELRQRIVDGESFSKLAKEYSNDNFSANRGGDLNFQEKGSLALRATGAISDDGIIDPRDTRTVLGMCLSVAANREVAGAEGYGVFRL